MKFEPLKMGKIYEKFPKKLMIDVVLNTAKEDFIV